MTTPTPTTRRGPRCHCGTPITHTPGKVPRTYCSDRCRKAAKRALTRATAVSGGNPGQLGKKTTEFPTPSRPAETQNRSGATEEGKPPSDESRATAARARKATRYAGRRTLWKISGDAACKGCGRALMDPASGVIVAQTAAGTSAVLGLMQCGRIWLCPVCSATIRHRRAEEIGKGVVEWITQGGTAYLVTFTARHAAAHRLADLMDALQGTRKTKNSPRKPGAYQRLITGGTWAGRPDRGKEGIRDRVGYVGMIRATEVTLGQANGWHPHIHAIVLVGGRTEGKGPDRKVVERFEPGTAALEEWEGHWRSVWTAHLRQVDPKFTPSDKHGVDFKRLETVRDAEDLSQYIAKLQDGKDPALELARADLKRGRGTMAPFELLARIGDLLGGGDPDGAPGHGEFDWCLAKWHEYERATSGRRAIEWTRHLRTLLGLDGGDTEDDDQDLLAESAASGGEFRGGVRVTDTGWSAVAGRALDLAVIQAGEGTDANTAPEAMAARVTEVVVLAGGTAADAQQLGPAEVAQAYQDLLDALAQRREDAAARRKREKEHGQEDDADRATTIETARRAIARRANSTPTQEQ